MHWFRRFMAALVLVAAVGCGGEENGANSGELTPEQQQESHQMHQQDQQQQEEPGS